MDERSSLYNDSTDSAQRASSLNNSSATRVRAANPTGSLPASSSSLPPASALPGTQSNDPHPHLQMFEAIPRLDIEKTVLESGIPLSTLRVWEYRYNIPPSRSGGNTHKMYSWRDIAALRWLRKRLAAGLSMPQAVVELAKFEPAYLFGRLTNPRNFSLPPFHDLHELHDPLLRAISSKDEQVVEHLLSNAFAIHPALSVCQQLLLPVLQRLTELRQQGTLPLEIEIFAVQVTQAQAIYLIEAGVPARDAQRVLATIPLQAARLADMVQSARLNQMQTRDFEPLEEKLLDALLHMNEKDVQRLLDQAFLDDTVETVCMNLLQAVLYRIGTLWEQKQISVTIEHFATSIIRTRLASLFQSTPDVGQGSLILVGCAPKETHEMGALMLALFWRRAGFRISYLGQMVQTKSLLNEIRTLQPGIVCLSAMTRPRVRDLADVAHAIARLPPPRPTVCFGGGVFSRNANLARQIEGVYLGENATVATERLREMVRQAK